MFFLNCAIDIYDDDDYDNEVQHLHGQFLYPDIMLTYCLECRQPAL